MKEKEAGKWYELGRISQLQDIAAELRKMCGIAFERGKDEIAETLRNTSTDLESRYKKERAEYDKKYPK